MNNSYIYHHGIKGMKWGIRRYQRKDGSLTPAGKMRAKILQYAIDANDRDVADLKKHGYITEAKAVKTVGDRRRQKLAKLYERDGRNRYNKNYTEKQRKNDRTFYGKGSEKRINRRLNEDMGLKAARHLEVERRNVKLARKKRIKKTLNTIAIGSAFVLEDLALNDGRRTQLVINTSKKAARLGEQFVRRYL